MTWVPPAATPCLRTPSGLCCCCSRPARCWRSPRVVPQHFPTLDMNAQPVSGNQPVTFQADSVTYDKTNGLVSADGHVQAWQNDHVLQADRVTFDSNTNVAAA